MPWIVTHNLLIVLWQNYLRSKKAIVKQAQDNGQLYLLSQQSMATILPIQSILPAARMHAFISLNATETMIALRKKLPVESQAEMEDNALAEKVSKDWGAHLASIVNHMLLRNKTHLHWPIREQERPVISSRSWFQAHVDDDEDEVLDTIVFDPPWITRPSQDRMKAESLPPQLQTKTSQDSFCRAYSALDAPWSLGG